MRGQTTLDFAIGISVFLLATAFVFAFLPGMLDPFIGGANEKPVVADRVADATSQGMLGDPAEPYVLDSTCTLAFFREGDGNSTYDVPTECGFEDNDVSVQDRVGIQARERAPYGLRIRLVGDVDDDGTSDVLCNTGGDLTDTSPDSCGGTAYTVGESPGDGTRSVSLSRRAVYLPTDQGVAATLLVEVW